MASCWTAPRPRSRPLDERAIEHAALASPTRLRILDQLLDASQPLHLDDLAVTLQLHPSTVRGHLALLADAGFVESLVDHRGRPGRPRSLFRPTAKARVGTAGCLGYRTLAYVLSSYLHQEASEPAATGERAGRAWAAHLTRHDPPQWRNRTQELARISEILEGVGFTTLVERSDDGITLLQQSCPFAGVVDEHAAVVCGLHAGLLRGVIDGIGARLELVSLTGATSGSHCVIRLRARDELH